MLLHLLYFLSFTRVPGNDVIELDDTSSLVYDRNMMHIKNISKSLTYTTEKDISELYMCSQKYPVPAFKTTCTTHWPTRNKKKSLKLDKRSTCSAITQLPGVYLPLVLFWILDWVCYLKTPMWCIPIQSHDTLHVCSKLCNWSSLSCLVPQFSHLPPVAPFTNMV